MTQEVKLALASQLRQVLSGESIRSELLRGGAGSAVIKLTNRLLMLLLGILLARTLKAEGYGVYAYAFAIMGLLMVIAEVGMPTLLMREVSANKSRSKWGILRGALIHGCQLVTLIATGVTVIGLGVLWLMADGLSQDTKATTLFMLLALPLAALAKTVASAIRGLHHVIVGLTVEMLLRPLLVLMLIVSGFLVMPELREPQYAMAAQLGAALIALVIAVFLLGHYLSLEGRDQPASFADRSWMKGAFPFTLIGGAGLINNQADIIMLGWFRSAADVGIYSVAAQGAIFVVLLLNSVGSAASPYFADLYATSNIQSLRKSYYFVRRYIFLATLPIAGTLVFYGGDIAGLIFGPEFYSARLPLALLSMGYLINISFGPVGHLLQMSNFESVTAKVLGTTAVLNLTLNFMLIPPYGSAGAAIATSVSVSLYHGVLRYIVFKRIGF